MTDNLLPALPIPHCPVMLVLDTSHSMWGRGMQDQQDALRAFHKTLRALEFTDSRIDIAAVGMGENLAVLQPFTPLEESAIAGMSIRPKGDTPVGGALRLALDELRRWTDHLRQRGEGTATPQLLILSDGKSSDDFASEAAEIRRDAAAGRIVCRAVATGEHPDLAELSRIAGENVLQPDYGRLRETFALIGEKVSQTYEDAVPEILMAKAEPIAAPRAATTTSLSRSAMRIGRLSGRTVLVDGTNVCFWSQNGKAASLAPVLALARALDEEGADWQVCFDASSRHHLAKSGSSEDAAYEDLLRRRPEHFTEVPAGTCADVFLLAMADAERNSILVTNDQYRDHEEEFPFIKDKARIAKGIVIRNRLCVPSLHIQCDLEAGETEDAAEVVAEKVSRQGGKPRVGFLI